MTWDPPPYDGEKALLGLDWMLNYDTWISGSKKEWIIENTEICCDCRPAGVTTRSHQSSLCAGATCACRAAGGFCFVGCHCQGLNQNISNCHNLAGRHGSQLSFKIFHFVLLLSWKTVHFIIYVISAVTINTSYIFMTPSTLRFFSVFSARV